MSLSQANPLNLACTVCRYIDDTVKTTSPWKLVAYTTAFAVAGTWMATRWASRKSWNWEAKVKSGLRQIPSINQKLETELRKIEESLEQKYFKGIKAEDVCKEVPEKPWDPGRILERLKNVAGNARNGKNTGAYYIDNDELDRLILEVCRLARRTNPLHTDLSPLIRQLEAEIVRMTLSMFKGDEKTVGNVTTGGTDSIRHAVYTARERAKAMGLGADWEMVVPETAHPAFAKAANEYCIKLKRVPVYPQGHPKAYQLNVDEMRKAINGRTILVAGSVPPFPHGIPDNIEEISALLEKVDPTGRIGLHVDCCLGGFIVPWMQDAGYGGDIGTRFGFDVTRVTSISADTHKYGFGEKGTSVVMYRDHENWRKHQIFVETEWSGGIYATPTLPGSRSGRDIAAMWAVMAYMGKQGYIAETKKIIETTRAVTRAIREDEELSRYLEVMGDPRMMVVAFCSKDQKNLNIYDLKKELAKKGKEAEEGKMKEKADAGEETGGWYLSGLQKPPGIHLCTTAVHGNDPAFVEKIVKELKECIEIVLKYPEEKRGKSDDAVMYCTNEKFGEQMFIDDMARSFWDISGRCQPLTFKL